MDLEVTLTLIAGGCPWIDRIAPRSYQRGEAEVPRALRWVQEVGESDRSNTWLAICLVTPSPSMKVRIADLSMSHAQVLTAIFCCPTCIGSTCRAVSPQCKRKTWKNTRLLNWCGARVHATADATLLGQIVSLKAFAGCCDYVMHLRNRLIIDCNSLSKLLI